MEKTWGHDVGVGATALWICYHREMEELEEDPLFEDKYAKRFAGKSVVVKLFTPWQHFYYMGPDNIMASELKTKFLIPCIGKSYLAKFKNAPHDQYRLDTSIRNFGQGIRKRTFIIDNEVLGAIEAGVRQFIFLANGFDTRALRLAGASQCKWWLIDQPAVIDHLLDTVPELKIAKHVVVVKVKFGEEAWVDALIAAGYQAQLPAFALVEGLTMYLTQKENNALLSDIAKVLAPGSLCLGDHINQGLLRNPMFGPFLHSLAACGSPWLWGPANSRDFANELKHYGLTMVSSCAASDPTGYADMFEWFLPHVPQHRLFLAVKCQDGSGVPDSFLLREKTTLHLPAMKPLVVNRAASHFRSDLLAAPRQ